MRKELGWLGFGALSTSLLAHPTPDRADLDTTLGRLGVTDELVVLSARTIRNEQAMRRLAQSSWNLDDIDARYASFVERFRPLIAAYGRSSAVEPRTAFLVRTLLIQEYRKVLLRDPQLPDELLPAGTVPPRTSCAAICTVLCTGRPTSIFRRRWQRPTGRCRRRCRLFSSASVAWMMTEDEGLQGE